MPDSYSKYLALRSRHPDFFFRSWQMCQRPEGLEIEFVFALGDSFSFRPRLLFSGCRLTEAQRRDPLLDHIVFSIGMTEAISYWKAACSARFHLPAGWSLSPAQSGWWRKLIRLGLGEFFHTNGIPLPGDEMLVFVSSGEKSASVPSVFNDASPEISLTEPVVLVPVGGGKDSVVSLELLRRGGFILRPFVVNQRGATRNVIAQSGLDQAMTLEVKRQLDPVLFELNARGYLNGHTPFSALLAFTGYFSAWANQIPIMALSNESSANEPSVAGTQINHQYSKSVEFETDFRNYVRDYLGNRVSYFSLLRPLNELQISGLFASMPAYHPVFRSCNAASKTDSWCGACPKCLFTRIMLGVFMDASQTDMIFSRELYDNPGLIPVLDELSGQTPSKPFECVGTVSEVRAALDYQLYRVGSHLPALLAHYQRTAYPKGLPAARQLRRELKQLLGSFESGHYLSPDMELLLREAIEKPGFDDIIDAVLGSEALLRGRFLPHRIAILGFGQEGRSSFHLINRLLPGKSLIICDARHNAAEDRHELDPQGVHQWILGEDYLQGLKQASLIMRSPGFPLMHLDALELKAEMLSQTALLLELYGDQVCGITGTKGKSTTASLLAHLLREAGRDVVLGGNIGLPPLEMTAKIGKDTLLVLEMSSHQLEELKQSPAAAVLLNIFQEHLDHYRSYRDYQLAKYEIARSQLSQDVFFYDPADARIASLIKETPAAGRRIEYGFRPAGSHDLYGWAGYQGDDLCISLEGRELWLKRAAVAGHLPGRHNRLNKAAAAAMAAYFGLGADQIGKGLESFRGLQHRMEYAGSYQGIRFINDSISTVPESCMAAIESFDNCKILILGGYDRGLDYEPLMHFLSQSGLSHLFFSGPAGMRMHNLARSIQGFSDKQMYLADDLREVVENVAALSSGLSSEETVCLLSPAAASYDRFRDFRERGDYFKALVAALNAAGAR